MRMKRTVISLGISMALVLTGCGTTGSKGEKMTPETSAEETQEETQENIGSSLAKIETRVIIIARIIIGRDILLLPIPAFSMAILSLLALSIERKYVVPNKKAKDETIIKYWGTDNSAY